MAKRGQLKPEFANNPNECTDTSKLYVLPDGYIYAYMWIKSEPPIITYIVENSGYWRMNGEWVVNEEWNTIKTNLIPVTPGDQLSYLGLGLWEAVSVIWYDENETQIASEQYDAEKTAVTITAPSGAAYMRCYSMHNDIPTLKVEWITCQTAVPTYHWENTGLAFVPADYEDRIIELEKIVKPINSNVLTGKKYVACGDSFTEGDFTNYTDKNGNSGKSSDAYDSETAMYKTYPWWIAKRNGMTLVNEAKSGSDFTNISGAVNAFSAGRYLSVPADTDYITLMFGLNETGIGADSILIGTKEDTTNTTLWGAYNIVFEHFLTNMPYAKIGVIIPDAWMTKAYADAVKEICTYWGIPYLDLKDDISVPMGIGGRSYGISEKAKELRNAAFCVSDSDSHPNINAHEYRSTVIENFMRTL